jgi:hypothetical protein
MLSPYFSVRNGWRAQVRDKVRKWAARRRKTERLAAARKNSDKKTTK